MQVVLLAGKIELIIYNYDVIISKIWGINWGINWGIRIKT
jgi:hypothetical protein